MMELAAEDGHEARYLVIALHGLGASGADLFPLARMLWHEPAARWLFPDAPRRTITLNGGHMRAWYDLREMDFLADEDERGLRDSAQAIADLIDRQVDAGVPPRRIILLGFSQGGALALFAGLRYPAELGAVVALSAYLPLPKLLGAEASPAAQATPLFFGYGEMDEVIDPEVSAASAKQLRAQGYALAEFRFPSMQHTINLEEMGEVTAFLHERADNIDAASSI